MTLTEIASAIGGQRVLSGERSVIGVSTDTREFVAESVFFALRGENSDGHIYVRQAFDKGAVAAVVDHLVAEAGWPQLVVQDTLTALGDLAGFYRRKFDIPVIGVTGSVGKTSTKEMIAAVMKNLLLSR